MSTLSKTLGTVALAVASFSLQAEDFTSLMQVATSTWPEKTHIGVICDYHFSRAQVEDLARAAGSGVMITVADANRVEKTGAGVQILANRMTDFMVLLPNDRVIRDGSFAASIAISQLAMRGIPTVGTTPDALLQGAVFSMGDGTNHEVLVTNRVKGTVDVTLPVGTTFSQKASLPLSEGMATITVLSSK